MAIFVSDWASFDQVLPIARRYGLGLEIQEFTAPGSLESPGKFVDQIKNEAVGLPALSIHSPFAELVPASQDPLVQQVASQRFSQAYSIAMKTGASHLVLHSGYFPKTYQPERWISNSYHFWLRFLEDKPQANFFHLENVYEDDFNPLLQLVDKVNHDLGADRLTLNLDIGHVNANSSRTLEEWISGLGDRIRYTHIHNNGGSLDDHWRLDRGTIDIARVLDLLTDHAPRATWSVETTVMDIQPSMDWLVARGYINR